MKEGWQTKTLGDVCHVYQPETISQKQMKAGEFRVYGANGQIGWHNEFNHEAPQLILGCRGSCGTVHVTEPRSWINGNAMVVQPTSGAVNLSFLAYALKGGIKLADAITGTAQPQITRTSLMPLAISFPEALPEQQRIVALLDEAFAGLATAKANAERNLRNARAIFDSHLQSVFSQRRQGWEQRALGGLCSIARGGSPRPISEFLTTEPGGVNWIKISDATSSGKYIYRTAQTIRPEGAARSRMVDDGDFILSNSMSFGRPYIMRTSGCIHDGWLVLSDYSASLEQDYLYYVLGSQLVFRQFDRLAAGSTVRNLNIDLASRVVLPVPPLDIQRAIVQEVEALAEETQRLTRVYERKLAALDELRKTLLHKAFSGEL